MVYKRELSPTEARRHFVYVDGKHREIFPHPGERFNVVVGSQKIEVAIDKQWRIWAAMFWDKLPHFEGGNVVVLSKQRNGSFTVSIEE